MSIPPIDQSLAAIEASLRRLGRTQLLDALAPGIPARVVSERLAQFALTSTPDLDALYEWHNGCDPDACSTLGQLWMFPIYYLLSLDESAATYSALCESGRWQSNWWPVFADGGGDFYVANLNDCSNSQVYHFHNEYMECPIEFDSLSAMMATIAAAFKQGIYYATSQTEPIIEIAGEFDRLAAEMNPTVAWWNDPELA